MDLLRTAFFEESFTVYLVLVLVEVALFGAWYGRRRAVWLWRMLLPVALAGGVFFLERAVVTDRERILAALDEMALAAERQDIDALATHLDEHYRGWGLRKIGAVALAKASVLRWRIRKVDFLGKREIELQGKQRADGTVRVRVHYGAGGGRVGGVPLAWRLEWVKRADGWKVRHATLLDSPLL